MTIFSLSPELVLLPMLDNDLPVLLLEGVLGVAGVRAPLVGVLLDPGVPRLDPGVPGVTERPVALLALLRV